MKLKNKTLYPFLILFIGSFIITTLLLTLRFTLWSKIKWQGWISIISVCITILLLISNIFPEAMSMLIGLILPLSCRIITSSEAFAGFSNGGIITIVLLFVVAKALSRSGILYYVLQYILKKPKWLITAQLRLLIPVSILSGFTNNTPIVAIMIPLVKSWALSINIKASHLLMPLSFATILGGTCTIVGTSTNIIVASLSEDAGGPSIGFFDISIVGIPNLIIGLIYILLFSKFLLPKHDNSSENYFLNPREYTAAVEVGKKSSILNKSIQDAGLRNLQGIFLTEIWRNNIDGKRVKDPLEAMEEGFHDEEDDNQEKEIIVAPGPETIILENDILFFTGNLESMKIIYDMKGLKSLESEQIYKISSKSNHKMFEAVLSNHSEMIGKTVKQINFRKKYDAVIISIYRHNQRVNSKIGSVELKGGDVLLIEASRKFKKDSNFLLVSKVENDFESVIQSKDILTILFVLLPYAIIIVLNIMGFLDLSAGCLIIIFLYIISQKISFDDFLKSINFNLIIIMATGFGLGKSLEVSGAAKVIGNSIFPIFEPIGIYGILSVIFFVTAILSSFINNAAAVTLMFPIIFNIAKSSGFSLKAVLITLMSAGSASFITPIGYQTNLMVQKPGNYNWCHFFKFGIILFFINGFVTILICGTLL